MKNSARDIAFWAKKAVPCTSAAAAIIGSGPAGLTIAIILAQRGYAVTIFESHDRIGGVLRYGIPAFRLPKSILDRYQQRLLELGVRIRPNTTIGGPTAWVSRVKAWGTSILPSTISAIRRSTIWAKRSV